MTGATIVLSRDDRKRLGQYFTGEPLARVLAAMADVRAHSAVLDPMAGSGDMLAAAMAVGGTSDLTAVEIDPDAAGCCRARFGSSIDLRVGNAFDPSTWARDLDRSWDVVITNPPYVRYQRSSRSAAGRVCLPSAAEIRAGLFEVVDARQTLSRSERDVFRSLVEGYSGLADLAVPSWLLCAALVAPGGRLAMLVPDTWLSRDYALPVLYVLRRFFDLEQVVEDGEASWFEEALVRTTLVVARRVPTRPTAIAPDTACHVHARITPEAASDASLVGALHAGSKEPERRFAERLAAVARSGPFHAVGVDAQTADDAEFRDRLIAQGRTTRWGKALEPIWPDAGQGQRAVPDVPRRLRDLLGDVGAGLRTLDQLGWRVGQGLRTGANRFFYGEVVDVRGDLTEICVDPALRSEPLVVPSATLRIVVRKQADVQVAGADLERSPGRLITLNQYALPEDIEAARAIGVCTPYRAIPEPLADYVRDAAEINLGSDDEPRRLPELSAVITNVRKADPARPDRPPRYWYQLPPLAQRHTGALFMPRINHGHPGATPNVQGVVVDANFSTFWPVDDRALSLHALRALLSSTWAVASLESLGTVLGGGALKVEATQLRRLPLPVVCDPTAEDLAEIGRALGSDDAEDLRLEIDHTVWAALNLTPREASAIQDLRQELIQRRNPRRPAAL